MTENASTPTADEIVLALTLATMLVPIYSWMTRAETGVKGGATARGTANHWTGLGGMRPSIATLVSLHADGLLVGNAIVGEDLIPVPDVDFPADYVFVQGTGKNVKRFTTRRLHGAFLMDVKDDHPLATPAGVTVPDLTKWITAALPNVMEQVKAEREAARKAAEKQAASDLLEKTIRDMEAAVVVAEKNGLDVSVQKTMIAAFRAKMATASTDTASTDTASTDTASK